MSIRRVVVLVLLLGVIGFASNGCIMHRTVKEGDEVVAQGYVVKSPLLAP